MSTNDSENRSIFVSLSFDGRVVGDSCHEPHAVLMAAVSYTLAEERPKKEPRNLA